MRSRALTTTNDKLRLGLKVLCMIFRDGVHNVHYTPYFFNTIHIPIAMKIPPAIHLIISGETKRRNMSAQRTARAEVEIRAVDAAKNTVQRDFASEAKQNVAS